MSYFAENSLPIWMAAAIALTMALVVFLQTRSNGALGAMLAIVVIAAALLAVERMIETPREAVERTLYEIAAAVEANDVPLTLTYITPNAPVRKDAEELMPLVNIERARIMGTPNVELVNGGAVVKCRGLIIATNKQNGMKGGANDNDLTLTFVERDGRWLLQDYSSKNDWHRAIGRKRP
jgi:hypothetical protein